MEIQSISMVSFCACHPSCSGHEYSVDSYEHYCKSFVHFHFFFGKNVGLLLSGKIARMRNGLQSFFKPGQEGLECTHMVFMCKCLQLLHSHLDLCECHPCAGECNSYALLLGASSVRSNAPFLAFLLHLNPANWQSLSLPKHFQRKNMFMHSRWVHAGDSIVAFCCIGFVSSHGSGTHELCTWQASHR